MYTVNTLTGIVTRDADGVQVAPVSDMADPGFLAWVAWCEAGNRPATVAVPPFDAAAYEQQASSAIQAVLDVQAQRMGYDGILSAVSYAPSTHPKFGPEGRALLAWRDACWSHAYAVLAAVQAGQRDVPMIEQLLAELPPLVLPE